MTQSRQKLFGTDGIRGAANSEPMSVDTILKVGRAAACVFRKTDPNHRHTVIIGKDTRLSCYMFEAALMSGLCSMGADVYLVGPIPTPAIAYLTVQMRADAGIMISASHNPYEDNGVKFFGADGFKLADETEAAIEQFAFSESDLDSSRPASSHVGRAVRLDDARGRYISYLKLNFPRQLSLDGMKIVVDCANGATYRIAPTIFQELGASVVVFGDEPDGTNINRDCGALNPENLGSAVVSAGADIGIAFDGDGDRVMVSDERGRVFDGDDLLGILAPAMKERNELGKGVVGTVMTNFGLEKYFETMNVPFFRSAVGDRYVVEKMRAESCNLGGEQSGHLVALQRSTTGDGILSAILLMSELQEKQKPLSSYRAVFERYPQIIRNIQVSEKKQIDEMPKVAKVIQNAEGKLNGTGRVLVRYSGTEAKARVMVEGQKLEIVESLADDIAAVISKEIGVK